MDRSGGGTSLVHLPGSKMNEWGKTPYLPPFLAGSDVTRFGGHWEVTLLFKGHCQLC